MIAREQNLDSVEDFIAVQEKSPALFSMVFDDSHQKYVPSSPLSNDHLMTDGEYMDEDDDEEKTVIEISSTEVSDKATSEVTSPAERPAVPKTIYASLPVHQSDGSILSAARANITDRRVLPSNMSKGGAVPRRLSYSTTSNQEAKTTSLNTEKPSSRKASWESKFNQAYSLANEIFRSEHTPVVSSQTRSWLKSQVATMHEYKAALASAQAAGQTKEAFDIEYDGSSSRAFKSYNVEATEILLERWTKVDNLIRGRKNNPLLVSGGARAGKPSPYAMTRDPAHPGNKKLMDYFIDIVDEKEEKDRPDRFQVKHYKSIVRQIQQVRQRHSSI